MKADKSSHTIGLYYFRCANFGDSLNEYLFSEILHQEAVYENFPTADVIGVGSLLERLLSNGQCGKGDQEARKKAIAKPIYVWGTGMLFQTSAKEQRLVRPLDIRALRGDRTRSLLSGIIGERISCVLADPGLLAPLLVPAEQKRWRVGIVPHYCDFEDPRNRHLAEVYPDSVIIDVQKDVKEVLREISRCETVLSTSLHGVIVSDAYGIPNLWCECSDKILGNGYKYHDYFSSFGTDREAFDLREGKVPDPDKLCRLSYRSSKEVTGKQQQLMECFPSAAVM